MSLLANVIGFSAFGFGARVFQLGLQKRGLWENPIGHIAAATIFGGIGYYAYGVEQRQNELIAHKKKVLTSQRDQENAALAG